ncbi:MAG: MFS transporter [Firmicutes bacterium]|nr:MFS transporter [Alicyclobacillaceae bacterium]MCL6497256.1 MFS transporter [Bacillota bacterium]
MNSSSEAVAGRQARPVRRGYVLGGIILTLALSAMDSTIVATAIPSIVRDLGGFSLFPWVFSVYLLVQSATIPLYGKLSDLYGRKPVLLVGSAIFLLGSVLSGLSWNMVALIVFRGIQGIGAGAVQPVATTVVGDLYTLEERGRIQGYVSSVWGISAIFGPAVGGFLVEYASWHWIFFINLPIGAAALAMVGTFLHEAVEPKRHRIDYAGAILLTASMGLIIFGLLQGGVSWAWMSWPSAAIFAGGIGLFWAFLAVERRAAEPVMPLWVYRYRFLSFANLASLVVGALMIGLTSFLPTFAQAELGASPVVAGFALAAMSVGWPLASAVSGVVYLRIGFRQSALLASLVTVAASLWFLRFSAGSSPVAVTAASFLMGVGLGLLSTSLLVGVQSVVSWNRRGVATGANMFTRMLGSTVGVAVFGSLVNAELKRWFAAPPPAVAPFLPRSLNAATLVLGGQLPPIDPRALDYVRQGLYRGIHEVFWGLLAASVLGIVLELGMPRRADPLPDDSSERGF